MKSEGKTPPPAGPDSDQEIEGHKKMGGARAGAGRPQGRPNKVNVVTRERIECEADPIGFLITVANGKAIEAAIPMGPDRDHTEKVKIYPTFDQRLEAHTALLRKLVPDAKSMPVKLNLPSVESAADVLTALNLVVAAVACGEITPDQAETLSGVLETRRRAIETVEFEQRLSVLEKGTK
jgi:hypothetical protein